MTAVKRNSHKVTAPAIYTKRYEGIGHQDCWQRRQAVVPLFLRRRTNPNSPESLKSVQLGAVSIQYFYQSKINI